MNSESSPLKQLMDCGLVSQPYASQIASGSRAPSVKLAIKIYRATGLKFGPIENANPRQITAMEQVLCGEAA